MRLEILRGLAAPEVIEGVTRVLVTDDLGTPLALSTAWMDGAVITTTHVGEANFQAVLRSLGVDRAVRVDALR